MEQEVQLNEHNKAEYPPMHTAEHILNQTMVRLFGCPRSRNAHIERKKSKCDYQLSEAPTAEQMAAVEQQVNDVIDQHLPITIEFMPREEAAHIVDLSKLPAEASETLRIVRIGDYEVSGSATLKSALQSYKVGDTVTITVVRSGRYAEVSVTLIEDKPAETKIELSTERQ